LIDEYLKEKFGMLPMWATKLFVTSRLLIVHNFLPDFEPDTSSNPVWSVFVSLHSELLYYIQEVTMMDLQKQIQTMSCSIQDVLSDIPVSIYLYGSITMDDFQYGWSDIDLLCLTGCSITHEQAQWLVGLRQELVEQYRDPVYRLFEGGLLSLQSFLNRTPDTVVYWGTSGQQITDTYNFDSFGRYELKTNSLLIAGREIRNTIIMPTNTDMRKAVQFNYETIRKHAVQTGETLYSCGWLLDIARCIYTLRTGVVIAKTKAGEWALEQQICPVPETLKKVLLVRKEPLKYKDDLEFKVWARSLGNDVQRFADVLEQELGKTDR